MSRRKKGQGARGKGQGAKSKRRGPSTRAQAHPEAHAHAHAHAHSHPHQHPHSHSHPHPHSHPHDEPPHPHVAKDPLARNAGAGMRLHFDCFSGVAGDMTIAALLDLGVPLDAIRTALAALPLGGYELAVGQVERSGIGATSFDVHVAPGQPLRTYATIDAMLAAAALEPAVKERARAIFRRLGEAESEVHRMPLAEVHFHEVGAVDAIVDIVGAAAGLAWLGAGVSASPLPLGGGFVNAAHGILPLPAPAVLGCLRGAPTYASGLDVELTTPTGAAIVATAAASFERWPRMTPERTGYGAGKRELADRPNLLRVVLGRPEEARADSTHVVVEANVDDMSGELAAYAISALLAAGALDAWAIPITMKKGRPALTIAAVARAGDIDAVIAALLRETTTIGVRIAPVSRIVRERHTIEVETRFGRIPIKVSDGAGVAEQVKPEFDACSAAAARAGVPVRVVIQEATAAYFATTLASPR
jgi:pyridinium-3,5-bisthiocarboxylic acid mononucleotide nickel chelatase